MNLLRSGVARMAVALVSVALLVSACSWRRTAPTAVRRATQPRTTPRAADLFPDKDLITIFAVQDHGAPNPIIVQEQLLREGDRLVGAQNGKPYVTWYIQPDGVWRLDPKDGSNLLQYLPAVLTDDLAWKQVSGNGVVWFHLERQEPLTCANITKVPTPQCWKVTVLNQGESIAFTFATGVGPVLAVAETFAHPAASFVKTLQEVRAGGPNPGARTPLLVSTPADRKEPPQPISAQDFAIQAKAMVTP
jgi:hypothetical protein